MQCVRCELYRAQASGVRRLTAVVALVHRVAVCVLAGSGRNNYRLGLNVNLGMVWNMLTAVQASFRPVRSAV